MMVDRLWATDRHQQPEDSLIRLAIVGCGRIAARHVEAACALPSVEVAVLVDPIAAHAAALAERFGLAPQVVADIEDAFPDVDAAVIATPNHLHVQPAVACLSNGIPVLIEKPLAVSTAEGERICQVAAERNTTVAVGYVTRFRQNVQLMASLLETGYFGRLHRFVYQAGTRGGWAPLSGYNLDRKASGGGVLVVTGTHFLDRMLYWFGMPEQATLRYDSQGGPEANAVASFHFHHERLGDFVGEARFSKTVKLPSGLVMETDEGTVILLEGDSELIRFRPKHHDTLELALSDLASCSEHAPDAQDNLFALQLADFLQAIQGDREPMVTGKDGLASLRLLEQLYRTAAPLPADWYGPSPVESREVAHR